MSSIVGKKAPHFSAKAVVNGGEMVDGFSLDQYLGKKTTWYFSFTQKDFTFVCPTELHAFQSRLQDFKDRGAEVVACSTDTEESHWGWLQMSKSHWRYSRHHLSNRRRYSENHQHELRCFGW